MKKLTLFDAIEENKRQTWILIFIFFLILFSVSVAFSIVFNLGYIGILIGFLISVFYIVFVYFSASGSILNVLGARELKEGEEPYLRHIVEGLAIASNIPVPKIWILESKGMNAFAVGLDPKNSHVVFTRGLLNNLTKEEIEGVAAHEISHIANFDTRFATVAVGLVLAISLISNLALSSFRFSRNGNNTRVKESSGILFLISILFLIISPIIAELIRFAISREREYLADATAAKLTRNPEGLAKALEKISRQPYVETATSDTASLFIADPFAKKFSHLFATHPPIELRIKRLRNM